MQQCTFPSPREGEPLSMEPQHPGGTQEHKTQGLEIGKGTHRQRCLCLPTLKEVTQTC